MDINKDKATALLELARNGPFRARDLDEKGIERVYLTRLCTSGQLERVGRGLYRLADARPSEWQSAIEVTQRVPRGVICLLSALQIYGFTSEMPHRVWIMIRTPARRPRPDGPQIEVVRASGAAFEFGVDVRVVDGKEIRVTSPAKTVADCFRYRRYVGLELALAALRDYLSHDGQPSGVSDVVVKTSTSARRDAAAANRVDALVEAARADRIWSVLRPYVEALV